jgi:hypothetical protein
MLIPTGEWVEEMTPSVRREGVGRASQRGVEFGADDVFVHLIGEADKHDLLTPVAPLTMTATFMPSRLLRTLLSRVVFPAPRNPDRTVTGRRESPLTWAWS